MPVTKIRTRWTSGNLEFLDSSGNIILVPGAHGTDALDLHGAWIEYTRKD